MLVGRTLETGVIDRLIADARAGRGSALAVRGDAGVGKSVLLEYARTAADGFLVLDGVGIESEVELAFAGLHQVLHPVLARLDALPAPQAVALRAALALSEEMVAEPFRVALGVLGLLSAAAEEQPVLCLVDDAQWLDHASAAALLFVARRLEAEPVALLFGARDDPTRPFATSGIRELRPAPLSQPDAVALVAERMGPLAAPAAVDWVVAHAAGNPLALLDLPQALTAGQRTGREPMSGALPPPTSVDKAYLEQVGRTPQAVRQLLLLAAAEETGDRATIAAAATQLGLDLADLSLAEADGLVRVELDRVVFRHPLVRSAVYRGAQFVDRERAHRTLADVLRVPADADRRAWHRAAATSGTDDEVAAELEATAERARQRAGYAGAAAALERAAHLSSDGTDRVRRLLSAARAAWQAGEPDRTRALLDAAEPHVAEPGQRAVCDQLRGHIEVRSGSLLRATSLLLVGARAVAPHDPHQALDMLLDAGMAAIRSGNLADMAQIGSLAAGLEYSNDADRSISGIVVGLGSILTGARGVDLAKLHDDIVSCRYSDDPHVLGWAAIGAAALGEDAVQREMLDRAAAVARASGAVDTLVDVLEGAVGAAMTGSRYSVASEASEGLRLAREVGLPNAASFHQAVLGLLAGLAGQADTCRAYAAEIRESARASGMATANTIAQRGVALLDLVSGSPDETITRLVALRSAPPGESQPFGVLLATADLVEAYVQTGRRAEAREAFGPLAGFATATAPAWARALAARCRALLADGAEAEVAYLEALHLFGTVDRSFDKNRTQLLYGSFLRRQRRRADARDHLRAAVNGFELLGAEPWAERARVELRATGETARKRDPSTLTQLTPQEMQIARLVGEGNSNKDVATQLFLSPRTVEYHLAKVFAKLGISSRADLIRQAAILEPAG
jgi:DNA-binding CsgD family transcriptional regulator